MKTVLLVALVLFVSCERNSVKPLSPNVVTSKVNAETFLKFAKDKEMYSQLRQKLDLMNVTAVRGAEGVLVLMAKFKENSNKIYAVNSLRKELLYSSKMKDEKNGSIGLLKDGEAIIIEFKDGMKAVKDISDTEFENFYASEQHGGSGFCQREKGESFGECFSKESDEFCDSFISCVALATQPQVSIVIGLSCSCNA